jgi:hypothetical protein
MRDPIHEGTPMKRILLSLLVIMSALPLCAQDLSIRLKNLDLGIATYPDDLGNVTSGYVSYRLSERITSKLSARNTVSSETVRTDSSTDSWLYLSSNNDLEVFLDPLVLSSGGESARFALTAGGYYANTRARQAGFVRMDGAPVGFRVNSFDNSQSGWAVGPRAGLEVFLAAGKAVSLAADASVVPVFWFSSDQDIDIYPLVPAPSSHSSSGTGSPYIEAHLNLGFFNLVNIESSYSYQRQTCELGTATVSGSDVVWAFPESVIESHDLQVLGSLNLTLPNGSVISVGYGRKLDWEVQDGDTGDIEAENHGVFKIAYVKQK